MGAKRLTQDTNNEISLLELFDFSRFRQTWAKLVLTTKNVHFVKLSKCVTDFTIVFLSSRWSKNIYETSNLGSGRGSYAFEKISVWGPELPVCTSGLRPELLVVGRGRRSFARKWTTGTSGPRPELPVGTGTSGEAWPELPVGVYSESNFQISNRFVSRSVFGRGKLRK
jgi:hypothetical protein